MKKLVLAMLTLAAGCTSPSSATAPAKPTLQVRWFGALREIVHDGRTEATVRLADVLPGPHAWGLGAIERLNGELTIMDDVVWQATPRDGSSEVRRLRSGDVGTLGATLLVLANVDAWEERAVTRHVAYAELDAYLAELLRGRPDLSPPVALRIEGVVRDLRWHVVDGSKLAAGGGHAAHARTAVSGTIDAASAHIVGFYSEQHQGIFTHMGSHSHFHVLIDAPLVSGHVDALALTPEARIYLPARTLAAAQSNRASSARSARK